MEKKKENGISFFKQLKRIKLRLFWQQVLHWFMTNICKFISSEQSATRAQKNQTKQKKKKNNNKKKNPGCLKI